ncbi:zinc ribbon domain-containing protein [Natrononativus amylolyticus]|uniref:zinc ribbon domain-containing protein n=1 Tax=Natrononativus amylolyticus TaxID=2963434 RepID=UPI0020CE266C|nr:zinc ribbon domain-containing protein [Natrononativus amylolyticus]
MTGITGIGAYVPQYSISAKEFRNAWGEFKGPGISKKAVPAFDEDSLTMAYEAAKRALDAAETDLENVGWLGFASSRPPIAEGDLTAHLGAMLAIPHSATLQLFTGSTRAGTRALWAGIDAIEAGVDTAVVVAADAPYGKPDGEIDHSAGAGAAAFVLESDGPAEIKDRGEYATPYSGTRFRNIDQKETTGLGITQYDRNAFTDTISQAMSSFEADLDTDAVAVQAPNGKLPYRLAKEFNIDAEKIQNAVTVHKHGDLGAASVPISLSHALASGHETVLAVSYGSGSGADAVVVKADGPVPNRTALETAIPLTYTEYLRHRGVITTDPPAGGGAYVSIPTWQRSLAQRYRLKAGRCSECGALSFPPEGACESCGKLAEYELEELSVTGKIETVTTISQGGAPPEFAEQQAKSGDYVSAIISFDTKDNKETVSLPAMGTSATSADYEIGEEVTSTIRRIYTQEGVTRYGFKMCPLSLDRQE